MQIGVMISKPALSLVFPANKPCTSTFWILKNSDHENLKWTKYIPKVTVVELRELNHDVRDFRGTQMEGSTDEVPWYIAQTEKRLIVSTDKGFSNRRFEKHYGILLIILHQPNRHKIHERVPRAVNQFGEEEWPNQTVTMRDTVQSLWKGPHIGDN